MGMIEAVPIIKLIDFIETVPIILNKGEALTFICPNCGGKAIVFHRMNKQFKAECTVCRISATTPIPDKEGKAVK